MNARENGFAHSLTFEWLSMWQNEGLILCFLPAIISTSQELSLLPVELFSEPTTSDIGFGQPAANACLCGVEFHHGKKAFEYLSLELLAARWCELS